MSNEFKTSIFEKVNLYINELSFSEQAKIRASFSVMESGDFKLVHIKSLHEEIKELKVKRHRFVFFIHNQTICFISAFMKKTNKTPKNEIEQALKIYKEIIKII